ncbi:MAG: PDZ domain-containing protein, partial [Verrucomicrobiota bacterium]|nr:PDZ domain-containing protein [Verrucomicrobiota bacterium]
NPFGLGGSVSRGILSSRNRRPAAEKSPLGIEDWLQTDAAINPGNSGGPLVNLRGELIGLNVAVFREQNAQGIGFAIPIKRVAEALSEIFTPEESPQQLWFGARVRSNFNSLQVSSVQSGSPAEKAGLRVGDSILQIGEKTPRNFIEFVVELLNRSEKNSNVPLIVSRNGERKSLAVQLIAQKNFFNADLIRQKLGVTLQEVTPDLAQALRLNSTSGFLVAGVDDKSPAQIAGVRRGYLITAIDGRVPADLTDLAKILYEKKKGEKAQLGLVLTRQQGNLIQARPAAAEVKVR